MRFSTIKVKSILISACIDNNRSNLFVKTYEFKNNKLIKKHWNFNYMKYPSNKIMRKK